MLYILILCTLIGFELIICYDILSCNADLGVCKKL